MNPTATRSARGRTLSNPIDTTANDATKVASLRAASRLLKGSNMKLASITLTGALSLSLFACMVGEDEALDATAGASIGKSDARLRGCNGVASKAIPDDGKFLLTTFGGPGDHQSMSCGGYADGTTWYAASRQRYGCGTKLKMEANGKCVVVTALDYGPDVCVENAAGGPIMDVSPRVARHLFGSAEVGWSERRRVRVTRVSASTPLGPCP